MDWFLFQIFPLPIWRDCIKVTLILPLLKRSNLPLSNDGMLGMEGKHGQNYSFTTMVFALRLKAIIHFRNRKKIKVHKFTNNLQGLQKVQVKDFSWNIFPWNALLYEKTLKQLSILDNENYGFIVNTRHDTAKRAETRVGFPVIFSRLRWRLSPNFHRFVILYISCGTRSVGLRKYCFPKVSNGFKKTIHC